MDGATLIRELRQILTEGSDSRWLDLKSCYDYLWEAACITADRTTAFTTTQTITTAANTAAYNLEPDFLRLFMTNNENQYFVKYNNGTVNSFIYFKEYDAIVLADNSTSQSIPNSFTILDAAASTQITGTASANGSLTNSYTVFGLTIGKTTLTAANSTFTTSKVAAGDLIHNTNDSSHGIVLSVTNNTTLIAAMFDGTNNFFSTNHAFIINPQGRYKVVFDPATLTANHTSTVYYVQRPAPVYDYYGSYPFAPGYKGPLLYYAAWKYKYRDKEPDYGDAWYKYWDYQVRLLGRTTNYAKRREGYKVNLVKKADKSGSTR